MTTETSEGMRLDDERLRDIYRFTKTVGGGEDGQDSDEPITNWHDGCDRSREILSTARSLPRVTLRWREISTGTPYEGSVYVIGLSGSNEEQPGHFDAPYIHFIDLETWDEAQIAQPSTRLHGRALPLHYVDDISGLDGELVLKEESSA